MNTAPARVVSDDAIGEVDGRGIARASAGYIHTGSKLRIVIFYDAIRNGGLARRATYTGYIYTATNITPATGNGEAGNRGSIKPGLNDAYNRAFSLAVDDRDLGTIDRHYGDRLGLKVNSTPVCARFNFNSIAVNGNCYRFLNDRIIPWHVDRFGMGYRGHEGRSNNENECSHDSPQRLRRVMPNRASPKSGIVPGPGNAPLKPMSHRTENTSPSSAVSKTQPIPCMSSTAVSIS